MHEPENECKNIAFELQRQSVLSSRPVVQASSLQPSLMVGLCMHNTNVCIKGKDASGDGAPLPQYSQPAVTYIALAHLNASNHICSTLIQNREITLVVATF